MRGASPPRGKGQGDEPITGGWGIWKALFFLFGFVVSVVVLFSVAGAPVPGLGIGDLLNKLFLGLAGLIVVLILAFVVWFARALASPETDLL